MTRLLVVEDDVDFADTLAEVFEAAGYRVRCAEDGLKGLDVCRQWHPHIVITDLIMPELEGIGLIRALKQEDEKPTIVAISGGGQQIADDREKVVDSYLETARSSGAALTYAKPVDFFQILRDVGALTADGGGPIAG